MKKFLAALSLLPSLLCGMVFESDQMKDILPHVSEGTLVLIDLDNTLIESSIHLGSAQWRDHVRDRARAAGYDKQGVEEVLDQFWLFVQPFVPVRIVDPNAAQVMEDLRKSHIPVIALTAREPRELAHTQKQIASTGVVLSGTRVFGNATLPSEFPGLYQDGVIYCGDNTKSGALLAFFEHIGKAPKKVVFVDDRQEQVDGLAKTMEEMGIEFVGIRFSGADTRVESFDGSIADVQFVLLPIIISDEEAQQLLSMSQG